MNETGSKVYALCDAQGRVTHIEGGYTMGNIGDIAAWTQIDEGFGDRYSLCQSNYLDKPIMDERGVYRYKLEGGAVVERTAAEMDNDAALLDEQAHVEPSTEELLLEMAGEHEYRLCLLEMGVTENDL